MSAAGPPEPLPDSLLLQVTGRSLQPLLAGLLGRELIREPLISAYGLTEDDLKLLQSSPFQLSLRPLASGPFQAGLELVLAPRGERASWIRMLDAIAERLNARGLQSVAETATSWRDGDERLVGGWRWLPDAGDQSLLQLFLGPEPAPFRSPLVNADQWQSQPTLQVRARPQALAEAALLPLQLPMPLQQADQLFGVADAPLESKDLPSRLSGQLVITPRQPASQRPFPPQQPPQPPGPGPEQQQDLPSNPPP